MKNKHKKGEGIPASMPLEKWEDRDKQKAVWDDASDNLFFFPERNIIPLILLPVPYLRDICSSALQ